MRQRLAFALMLVAATAASAADGIVAVNDGGRTVYVDAPTHPNTSLSSPITPHRASVLMYWSRSKNMWLPVAPPSPAAMLAARTAATEVADRVAAAPKRQKAIDMAVAPDNREILRDRAVSSAELDSIIQAAAQRHNVDPNLVRAVIKVESNFKPRAVSPKGAMGLMQLMPATARNLNVSNAFDPEQNVNAGVRHLRELLDSYQGDVSLSLAAYNAGSGAVARSKGVPPYSETRQYVRRITELYGEKRSAVGGSGPIRVYRDSSGVLTFTNTE
jgi:soluble lytic murein transglycosylase-like protein